VVVLSTAQSEKKREREGRRRKERGKFPSSLSLGQKSREKRERKEKGVEVTERGPCQVHVPNCGKSAFAQVFEKKYKEKEVVMVLRVQP
jgi:hypothetical protein